MGAHEHDQPEPEHDQPEHQRLERFEHQQDVPIRPDAENRCGPARKCDPRLLGWPTLIRALQLQVETVEIEIRFETDGATRALLLAERRRILGALEAAKSAQLQAEIDLRQGS